MPAPRGESETKLRRIMQLNDIKQNQIQRSKVSE